MVRRTKAELELENVALKAELMRVTLELESIQGATSVPPASMRTANRIAITAANPLFKGLPMYQPHTGIECPKHGRSRANKAGFCIQCTIARAMGGRAIA